LTTCSSAFVHTPFVIFPNAAYVIFSILHNTTFPFLLLIPKRYYMKT
jgi:preprotein translocase subunit SecB